MLGNGDDDKWDWVSDWLYGDNGVTGCDIFTHKGIIYISIDDRDGKFN